MNVREDDAVTSARPLPDAARAAAEWWGVQVQSVLAEADGVYPGLSPTQAFAAAVGIGLRVREIENASVSDSAVDGFVAELARLLAESSERMVRLDVDYHPCELLAQAADAAGVPWARFPGKTVMRVKVDHVLAKAGYGAPWRLVWSGPGWERPPCAERHWPDGSDDPVGPECALLRWHEGKHDWQ